MMRDYFQIAGELWTGVIVGFLLLAVAHYGYGKWLAYQQRKRLKRIEANVMAAVDEWFRGVKYITVAPPYGIAPEAYPRPMGVKPPEHGYILESRFHLDAENDQQAIDALMGKETAPDA